MAFAGIFVLSCGNLSCLKNTPLRKLLPIFERPQRREIRLTTKSRLEYPKCTTATFFYNTKLREIKGLKNSILLKLFIIYKEAKQKTEDEKYKSLYSLLFRQRRASRAPEWILMFEIGGYRFQVVSIFSVVIIEEGIISNVLRATTSTIFMPRKLLLLEWK